MLDVAAQSGNIAHINSNSAKDDDYGQAEIMANSPEKVVIVTGASSGLGRATALAFARSGARVVAVARRADRLQELVDACTSFRGEIVALVGDASEETTAASAVQMAMERFGRIDTLIANAGIGSYRSLLERLQRSSMRSSEITCVQVSFSHGQSLRK